MSIQLDLHSEAGRKAQNDDTLAHSLHEIPEQLQNSHGRLFIIADGVSAAEKGGVGSQSACHAFLQNVYKASPQWQPQAMAKQLLSEINQSLYNKGTHEYGDGRKGYACTFSALLIRSKHAHIFHLGDTRIYHRQNGKLQQITQDHSSDGPNGHSYLDNALGVEPLLQFDYHCIEIQKGDEFLLSCDGIHDVLPEDNLHQALDNFDAKTLSQNAYDANSSDNLSCLILRITDAPLAQNQINSLPERLKQGDTVDDLIVDKFLLTQAGYHYYLCKNLSDKQRCILKYPDIHNRTDTKQITQSVFDQMYLEQWQLYKCSNNNVCLPLTPGYPESAHYILLEYIESLPIHEVFQTVKNLTPRRLVQWVEDILETTLALKKLGLNHSALTPNNIFVTPKGELKFFCISLNLKGLTEPHYYAAPEQILYPAEKSHSTLLVSNNVLPEIFSCAAILYEYLCRQAPYRFNMFNLSSKVDLQRLSYHSIITERPDVPLWFDAALKKGLSLYPEDRYPSGKSFIEDLLQPNTDFLDKDFIAQYSRKLPVFPLWKLIAGLWGASIIIMGVILFGHL